MPTGTKFKPVVMTLRLKVDEQEAIEAIAEALHSSKAQAIRHSVFEIAKQMKILPQPTQSKKAQRRNQHD